MKWYSTCVRRICLVEGGGARYEDSVFIVLAADWTEARQKALAIGRSREETYVNSEGRRVRWAFERLVTIDQLGELTNGLEVYSQAVALEGPEFAFDHVFVPDENEPTQSV